MSRPPSRICDRSLQKPESWSEPVPPTAGPSKPRLTALSVAPRHLEGTAVEVGLDFGEVDAFLGEAGEREIEDVSGLVDDVTSIARLGQLLRLLAQLVREQCRMREQLGRIRAFRRVAAAQREKARQMTEAPILAPAGSGIEMAEPGVGLADDKAGTIAVAVEI